MVLLSDSCQVCNNRREKINIQVFLNVTRNDNGVNEYNFLYFAQEPSVGQVFFFLRVLDHKHNDAPQSVGPLWMSYQPVAETSLLITPNIHTKQKSLPPVGLEPKISVGELPQTYALDRAAVGTGSE
jgi:hypothetical protein